MDICKKLSYLVFVVDNINYPLKKFFVEWYCKAIFFAKKQQKYIFIIKTRKKI